MALRNYLVISDVHLGARSTSAEEILAHLTTYFDDFTAKSPFTACDVFFIAGDLWDDTIELASEVVPLFISWFNRLVRFCSRHQIALRILEGTPRHDRRQNVMLERLIEISGASIDFKYVQALSIEYMEELDLRVLYVPDECRPTAEAVARDTQALLDEAGLEKVDIAIMHGLFKYQLGTIPMNSKVHDEAWYLARVKHFISIGHIHTFSQYSRILAEGSFDRLRHGEEEAKGGIWIQETKPDEWMYLFVENTLAKKYLTIAIEGTVEQALKTIDKALRTLEPCSYVRIKALSTHPLFQGFETLRVKYPDFVFSKKPVAEGEESYQPTVEKALEYTPIVLNRETITEALFTEVSTTNELGPADEERLFRLLESLHT